MPRARKPACFRRRHLLTSTKDSSKQGRNRDNKYRKNSELDYKGLERRLTLFLLCLSLFPYKFNGESPNGVPTLFSHRSFLRLDLLRPVSPSSDCQIVPSNARMTIITRIKPRPPLG